MREAGYCAHARHKLSRKTNNCFGPFFHSFYFLIRSYIAKERGSERYITIKVSEKGESVEPVTPETNQFATLFGCHEFHTNTTSMKENCKGPKNAEYS